MALFFSLAEQRARELGCKGTHQNNGLWMPCGAHQWPGQGLNAAQWLASITAPMAAMIRFSAKLTTPRGVLEFPPTQAQLRAR